MSEYSPVPPTEHKLSVKDVIPLLKNAVDYTFQTRKTAGDSGEAEIETRWLTPSGIEKLEQARKILFSADKPRNRIPIHSVDEVEDGDIIVINGILLAGIIRKSFGKNVCLTDEPFLKKKFFEAVVCSVNANEGDKQFTVLTNGWLPEFTRLAYFYPDATHKYKFSRLIVEPIHLGHSLALSENTVRTGRIPQSWGGYVINLTKRIVG